MATAQSGFDGLHRVFQTRYGKTALSVSGIILFFGSWWFFTDATMIIDRVNVPTLIETYHAILTVTWERHVYPTFSVSVVAFIIAFVLSIGSAIGLTLSPRAQKAMMPYVVAGNSIPRIALAPIISIYFGQTRTSLVIIAAWVAFFPMFINAFDGFAKIDEDHQTLLQIYDASVAQEYFYIRLPNGLPNVFDGAKIGVLLAIIGVIVAEFVIGTNALGGLGYAARTSLFYGGVARTLAMVMVAGFFSTLIMLSLFFIQTKVVFWEDVSFFSGEM